MDEVKLLESMKKLVELGQQKKGVLEITDIDNQFKGFEMTVEQMEAVYQYLEENKIDEKRKERRKSKKKNNEVEENKPVLDLETKEEIIVSEEEKALISTPPVTLNQALEQSEKADDVSYEEDDLDLTLIDIFDTSRDKKKPNKKKETTDEIEVLETSERIPIKDKQPPTLFIDEDVVLEIKERNKSRDNIEESELVETNQFFPEVEEVSITDNKDLDNVEKPELLQISIIEEIDNLLRNDAYDLRDIKYRLDVLNAQEKDEVLLENVEKIQKEFYNQQQLDSKIQLKSLVLMNGSRKFGLQEKNMF